MIEAQFELEVLIVLFDLPAMMRQPHESFQRGRRWQYAGVSRDTIYTACERREIRQVRIGGRRAIRLKPEWIDLGTQCYMHLSPAALDAATRLLETGTDTSRVAVEK